ncbi:hypothetical protein [Marinomonas sp. IMCC 4694]|uniref:hypothetical protein n=1 Tax=Marinomonas sp. IMCC 4694 TaxID=2605432 RepID=UPI0011E6F0AB|nr:hypothetical protein [Marinomonas sp. IMCC 4694]TYL47824.1 hypothetical protein FXV75_07635 [Marinomonas sp. IMCC 4694]
MEVIFFIVISIIVFVLALKIFKMVFKALFYISALTIFVFCLPAIALGYCVSKSIIWTNLLRASLTILSVTVAALPFYIEYYASSINSSEYSVDSWAYFFVSPLFLILIPMYNYIYLERKCSVLKEKSEYFFTLSIISFSFFILSLYSITPIYLVKKIYDAPRYFLDYDYLFVYGYLIISVLIVFHLISIKSSIEKLLSKIDSIVESMNLISYEDFYGSLDAGSLSLEEKKLIFSNRMVGFIEEGVIKDTEFSNSKVYYFSSEFIVKQNKYLEDATCNSGKLSDKEIVEIIKNSTKFDDVESLEFTESFLDFGEYKNFEDGKFFVSYKSENIISCICCGKSKNIEGEISSEWYCSKICEETDKICDGIKKQDTQVFIENATTTGFILLSSVDAWVDNHKMFAIGSQGHGFAAENANNIIDRLKGKDATVIGGDNSKNGADRFVNGEFVQTKYCATPARTVGSAFDGQDGSYRYVDSNNKPMLLEVPKDQYDQAVKVLEVKIKDGKVPGVSDPKDAQKIIVKGSVTYDQARNITRFGTIESISYDFVNGAVIGLKAGGISSVITTVIVYAKTKDKSKAIKAGLVTAVKTFGKTTTIYIGTQQLQRLGFVQGAVKNIDISNLSPTLQKIGKLGTGAKSVNQANSALRGTIITSVVIVAVTTGPDLLKICRGRISSKQFLKNLTIAASSTAGSVAGSLAGAAVCSPLGPAGVLAGRFVGGAIGGYAVGWVSKVISNKFVEDDREIIIKIITQQVQYLSCTFMLNDEEMINLNENLTNVLNDKIIENIYAAKNDRIAAANQVIKPIVTGIVKQRFVMRYDQDDIDNEIFSMEKEYSSLTV